VKVHDGTKTKQKSSKTTLQWTMLKSQQKRWRQHKCNGTY
jgi:cell wall assembly regulator SMI1